MGSALLDGAARTALTLLSVLTLGLLLGLSAPFVWSASLVPVVAMAMFWGAARLFVLLSARGPVGFPT